MVSDFQVGPGSRAQHVTQARVGQIDRHPTSAFNRKRPGRPASVAAAAKLEVAFVQHSRDRGGVALTGIAGELAGGQPCRSIPDAGLESGIEMGKLRLQARFTGLSHGLAAGFRGEGYSKIRLSATRCLTEPWCPQ
jgi:hypothetical protein